MVSQSNIAVSMCVCLFKLLFLMGLISLVTTACPIVSFIFWNSCYTVKSQSFISCVLDSIIGKPPLIVNF